MLHRNSTTVAIFGDPSKGSIQCLYREQLRVFRDYVHLEWAQMNFLWCEGRRILSSKGKIQMDVGPMGIALGGGGMQFWAFWEWFWGILRQFRVLVAVVSQTNSLLTFVAQVKWSAARTVIPEINAWLNKWEWGKFIVFELKCKCEWSNRLQIEDSNKDNYKQTFGATLITIIVTT